MSLINVEFPNQGNNPNAFTGPPVVGGKSVNFDLFDLIKRKFWLILFFTIAGIGLSMLYFFKAPKTYQSTARIFVDEKNAAAVSDGESYSSETSIEQYLLTLKSTKILLPAIKSGDFHELETFAECEDILSSLRDGSSLSAKPADTKTKSGVIKVAFKGSNPEECEAVLREVISSFDDHIKATTRNVGGETAQLVSKVQNEMLAGLNEVESEIQKLTSSPEVLNVEGRIVNPHQIQLSMLMKDLHELRRERTKLEARVKNVEDSRSKGIDDELIAEILRESAETTSAGAYVATHDQYVELKVKEQELVNQFGPDHPDLQSLQRKLEVVNEMRMQEMTKMRAGNSAEGQTRDIVKDYVNQIKRSVETLKTEEAQLASEVKNEQILSTSVSTIVERLNTLQRKRERLEKGYYAIVEQLSQINALKEHLWRNLSILDPPSAAEQIAPSLPISGAAGLFLGSLLGLLFAGFKEMAEKTFRSSDDVAAILNTSVVGHVNFFQKIRRNKLSPQFPKVRPELVTIHAPASVSSESYRAIRTAMFFRAQESGAKVIQVTSPIPGDGKSTTISNLAASIAQSGRRVLLVDADLRKPTQQKMFGVTNDFGLSSAITGEMDPLEVVQVIQPEYLSLVTSGPIPANPAELLTSARFEAILDVYREKFDFVLIDTPPILAVTDPSIVSSHVDLVYFVMRIRNGVRETSTRAKQIIDSMGIDIGGIIINGLRRRDQKTYKYSGQYGYGQYKYGGSQVANRPASPMPDRPATRVRNN